MASRSYEQVQEEKYTAFGSPKLALDHKLAIYGRQSTKEQVEKNHGAYLQQAVKLVDLGKEFGFTGPDDIIVFIENKSKNGKWVNASGRLRIDQRPGLSALIDLINKDIVKTVLVWAVDRLFRDEDMIQPPVFVKACKDHHVIVFTIDDYFDFTNKKRDDRRRFLELAQAAADYITKHIAKMRDALSDASKRGEYDGRGIPTGYYLPKNAENYVIFALYAPIIRWLFKRFRQLNGKFNALCFEIAQKEYLFPFPPEGMEAPYMRITKVSKGYTLSRPGLRDLLTNVAYIGYWYYKPSGKSTLIIKDHHPALIDGKSTDIEGDVVTEDDFWYAFKVLSETTIDGVPLEPEDRPTKPPTHQTKLDPCETLLQDVITSEDNPVYVIQNSSSGRSPVYSITNIRRSLSSETECISTHLASIAVKKLDPAFVALMKFRLRYFQAIDKLLDKTGQERKENSMYQELKKVQQAIIKANISVDEQVSAIKRKIARFERILEVADKANEEGEEELDEKTIIDSLKQLKRLRKSLAELESKKAQATATEEDLREIAKRLTDAADGWDSLTFERQKKLVNLTVKKATLTQINSRWMLLDVEWLPFMGVNFIDRGYIFNSRGQSVDWSDEDRQQLREFYPTIDRDTLLNMFPTRSWIGIYCQASEIKLRRQCRIPVNTMLPQWMSYEDKAIIDKYGVDLGEYGEDRPERHYWWTVLDCQENERSVCAAFQYALALLAD